MLLRNLLRSVAAIMLVTVLATNAMAGETMRVYIGTYTGGESQGIYRLSLDMDTGQLAMKGVTKDVVSPSFLTIHESGKYLYAVNEAEVYPDQKSGGVSAFAIAKNGDLKFLNRVASRGNAPCHLVVDATGKYVLVANYTGGNVATFPIQADGSLKAAAGFVQHKGSGADPRRQKGPHAHSINLDAGNRFAVAADLGLDKLLVYRFDPRSGSLTANDPAHVQVKPGSGPRHFAFHPNGKFAFVINEMLQTVTAFSYDSERGALKNLETHSTVPKLTPGNSTAEVQVHPSGKFLYGSNRGHDSIVVFKIDRATGKLTYVENESTGGKTPRNFGIDPTGKYLLAANQSTNSVVVFRIDPKTGGLTPTGHRLAVPTPVCVKFMAE